MYSDSESRLAVDLAGEHLVNSRKHLSFKTIPHLKASGESGNVVYISARSSLCIVQVLSGRRSFALQYPARMLRNQTSGTVYAKVLASYLYLYLSV